MTSAKSSFCPSLEHPEAVVKRQIISKYRKNGCSHFVARFSMKVHICTHHEQLFIQWVAKMTRLQSTFISLTFLTWSSWARRLQADLKWGSEKRWPERKTLSEFSWNLRTSRPSLACIMPSIANRYYRGLSHNFLGINSTWPIRVSLQSSKYVSKGAGGEPLSAEELGGVGWESFIYGLIKVIVDVQGMRLAEAYRY